MVYIYVLKLIKGKYYVGKTSNPRFRIDNHFNKNGSEWTRVYKPINIHQIIPNCDDYDEDKYTIQTMEKYGINNVRGGSFCQFKLSSENKKTLERMINGSSNSCYKCGEKGHFANRCSYESEEDYEYDCWSCDYCGKVFDTKKGAQFHENVHCKMKKKSSYKSSNGSKCYRCGRKGHYSNNCYASKHVKGYYLK